MNLRRYYTGPGRRFPANAKGLLATPVLWFAWFIALYSTQGAGCAIGMHDAGILGMSALRFTLAALTLAAAAAIAIVGFWSFGAWEALREGTDDEGGRPSDQAEFLSYGAALNAALFFVAVLWTGMPILMADELCHP
jgi:hypothetical protein